MLDQADVLDRPKDLGFRGTCPARHPWFVLPGVGGPPNIPPDTRVVYFGGFNEPPEEDQCPRCRSLRFGVCKCGYDWDNWEWVDR